MKYNAAPSTNTPGVKASCLWLRAASTTSAIPDVANDNYSVIINQQKPLIIHQQQLNDFLVSNHPFPLPKTCPLCDAQCNTHHTSHLRQAFSEPSTPPARLANPWCLFLLASNPDGAGHNAPLSQPPDPNPTFYATPLFIISVSSPSILPMITPLPDSNIWYQ